VFFVIQGGLDVLDPEIGDLDYRVENGGHIGELGLLTEVRRYTSAVSHTYTLISILSKEDFDGAISTNSEVRDKVQDWSDTHFESELGDKSDKPVSREEA
jgi:hypothetical protein